MSCGFLIYGTLLTQARDFADVWTRLTDHFKNTPDVYYAIMSEPVGLRGKDGLNAAEVWEKAAQRAVGAIRANGDDKTILVNGYRWSSLADWDDVHPDPWITDPADNFFYTAHHYWDRNWSGQYSHSYADEVEYAQANP